MRDICETTLLIEDYNSFLTIFIDQVGKQKGGNNIINNIVCMCACVCPCVGMKCEGYMYKTLNIDNKKHIFLCNTPGINWSYIQSLKYLNNFCQQKNENRGTVQTMFYGLRTIQKKKFNFKSFQKDLSEKYKKYLNRHQCPIFIGKILF